MVVLLSFILSVLVTVSSYRGNGAHYREGLMIDVAHNRGLSVEDCMVAATYEEIGTWIYIRSDATGYESWCRVTDIPAAEHRQSIIDKGIVVEFGWEITPEMCGIHEVGQEPPSACPVTVYHLADIPVEPVAESVMEATCQFAHQHMTTSSNAMPNGSLFPLIYAE